MKVLGIDPGTAALGWGIVGVWIGLDVLIVARLAFLGVRFAGRRWAVVGWAWHPTGD